MSKIIDNELEDAILNLPVKERNKLLLRLIRKDKILTEQLHFKLLEHPEIDLKLRESEIYEYIDEYLYKRRGQSNKTVLLRLREIFSKISHHHKITGDKIGEVRLSVRAAYITCKYHQDAFENEFRSDTEKLSIFIRRKVSAMLNKYQKIHEDYKIEFFDQINESLEYLENLKNKTPKQKVSLPTNIEE